ncbi:helix-turn-helix transcriptional regulator [Paenibacillus sp. UNC451MF]|uniref:helix-turn-helix transcriptional regulator n=1 Tax=Paenibacillus sp. UNC451MF TaxID=1449063 RepID=UPI00048CC769|nr:AraC family transcriptional regulator [Paenibacillus sp. UNC451MF]
MKEYAHEYRENYNYTPSEFEKLGGIWPLRMGHNKAKSNYFVGPKVIDCYSLHFILSGSVFLSHGTETTPLQANDIFCLHPQIKYSYSIHNYSPEAPLRMYWLAFSGTQALSILQRIGFTQESPYLRERLSPELLEWIKKLFHLLAKQEKNTDLQAQINLYSIMDLLTKDHSGMKSKQALQDEWLKRSMEYMNTHYMEGITVMDAVQVAGVHRSHYYNEFLRMLGVSPRKYLIQLRMERASELLLNTTLNITEIARSTGYPDLYSFSRSFFNYYGMSPTEFRSTHVTKPT